MRYHDIKVFSKVSNLDLVEIHLSYKDLEVELDQVLPERQEIGLVVHAPELFAGDHTLDLCTADEGYRDHSIRELQRVIDISRDLRSRFRCPDPVLLVTNVGGFSEHRHLDRDERKPLQQRLIESLGRLNCGGDVEIIPQTMPPFPWHFGGQRFHNLFVDPSFIHSFCEEQGMRVCLDVSHSKLACNHLHLPFRDFLNQILPFTAHLHLADARDVDGEGLQIQDGEIDWVQLFEQINQHCPRPRSFRRSGKATRTAARGPGSPWNAWKLLHEHIAGTFHPVPGSAADVRTGPEGGELLDQGRPLQAADQLVRTTGFASHLRSLLAGLHPWRNQTGHPEEARDLHRSHFSFSFVRNPFDRLVAAYNNKLIEIQDVPQPMQKMGLTHGMAFEQFIDCIGSTATEDMDNHVRPQAICWFCDDDLVPKFVGAWNTCAATGRNSARTDEARGPSAGWTSAVKNVRRGEKRHPRSCSPAQH